MYQHEARQATSSVLEVNDSAGNPYEVKEVNAKLVKIRSDSRLNYNEDGADEIIGFVDEVCSGDGAPSVSYGVNTVTVFMRVEEGCLDKIVQQGTSSAI